MNGVHLAVVVDGRDTVHDQGYWQGEEGGTDDLVRFHEGALRDALLAGHGLDDAVRGLGAGPCDDNVAGPPPALALTTLSPPTTMR